MQNILKSKELIVTNFHENVPASRKHSDSAKYDDADATVYKWYRLARERLVPVFRPMLQKSLMIAEEFGNEYFKASNGWLQLSSRDIT